MLTVLIRKQRFLSALCALSLLLLTVGTAAADSLRAFTSDGCSLFPDGELKDRAQWCDCCLIHDIAYWQGGTSEDRQRADEALRKCVIDRTKSEALADLMYDGVRAGGHPAFPTWYRWAYGWPYGRGYKQLTEQEQTQVREKIDAYQRDHPDGYCIEQHKTTK